MSGKYNYLIRHCDFIVIVLATISQLLQVHARIFTPIRNVAEPKPLLSWEDNAFSVGGPAISDSCQQAFLCENVGNYPTQLVAMILNKLNISKFTNDKLYESEYDPDNKDLGEIQDLCEVNKERIMFPRAGKDKENKWQFIINMPRYHFQSFRVHECSDSEFSCSKAAYVNDLNYSLKCEQKFTKRKMIYLDLEKKIVTSGYFKVPSCCACYLAMT